MPKTFNRTGLEAAGYVGWASWQQLRESGLGAVPRRAGCYVVYRLAEEAPAFLPGNPGGRFKGKDPTVSPDRLAAEWVPNAHVIYIGKADDLRTRLTAYARFGAGEPVAHWGGRLIWQVAGSDKLRVAWHELTTTESARDLEKRLLTHFVALHGAQRPFANLTG